MKKLFTRVLWLSIVFCTTKVYSNEALWSLICPNDTTVACSADISDLSKFGNAVYHDHNGYHSAGTPVVKKYLNGCGGGYITRTWTVEDPYWNLEKCTQTIYVGLPGGTFKEKNIHWPQKEVFLTGCDPDTDPSVTGKPTYDQVGCSMIAVGKTDNLYEVNASCKKLIRRWKVMDWCQANGGAWAQDGIWYFDQYIMIINNDIPEVDCPNDTTVVVEDCNYGEVVLPTLEVDPSSCGGEYTITNNSPYARSKGANASGRYPVGKTKVVYTIQYGCGSKKYCEFFVTVKGGKAPTPICIAEVAVPLMGRDTDADGRNDEGMVQIWAKDLNLKSEPGCGGSTLFYSFSPDSIVMFKTFTCDDLGPNPVKMYVSDKTGNQSYCLVNVVIQNNKANIIDCVRKEDGNGNGGDPNNGSGGDPNNGNPPASNALTISGKLTDAFGKPVSGAKIGIIGENVWKKTTTYDTTTVAKRDSFVNSSGITIHFNYTDTVLIAKVDSVLTNGEVMNKTTGADGLFRFENMLELKKNYLLKPEVSTLPVLDIEDLKILVDYAFGYKSIKTDIDLYRSDLNEDGLVNMEDVDLMIKYLREANADFYGQHKFWFNENLLGASLGYAEISASKTSEKIQVIFKGDLSNVNPTREKSSTNNLQSIITNRIDQFDIFPNPTDGQLNVNFNGLKEGVVGLRLFDQTGRLVKTENWQANKGEQTFKTDVSTLLPGIYFYQVQSDYSAYSGKIIKQ